MAMLIAEGSAGVFGIQGLTLYGDGVSTSITIDVSKAPFDLLFNSNPPALVFVIDVEVNIDPVTNQRDPTFTCTATLAKDRLTLTFNKPVPAPAVLPTNNQPQTVGVAYVSVVFLYNGE